MGGGLELITDFQKESSLVLRWAWKFCGSKLIGDLEMALSLRKRKVVDDQLAKALEGNQKLNAKKNYHHSI
jgi:hypothetical protein